MEFGLLRTTVQRHFESSLRAFATFGLIVFLTGCASNLQMAGIGPGDTVDPARRADFSAKYPPDSTERNSSVTAGRPWLFPGLTQQPMTQNSQGPGGGGAGIATNSSGLTDDGTGVVLNFDNADIQAVAKSVVSDTLGLNVVIDPRVQGTITLVSAKPIPHQDLLSAFEEAVRMSNAAVIVEGNLVKILPLSDAAGAGSIGGGGPGLGVTIIPLRYTSATTVAQAAENFLTRPGAVRADPSRNLLMIQGTADERQNALNVISSFDV